MDSQGIRFDVIVLRNKLSRGVASQDAVDKLRGLRDELSEQRVPMQRTWARAVSTALKCVQRGEVERAARELNFVHNLPLTSGDFEDWDSRYFFEFELLGYVEMSSEEAIREMLKAVGADLLELDSWN